MEELTCRAAGRGARVAAALTAILLVLAPLASSADAARENAPDRDVMAGRLWKDKLGLSARQVPKFLSAARTRDAELQPLRDQLRGGMRKLQFLLSENAPESDVQELLQLLARVRKAVALRNEQFDTDVASFLAPSQRAKLLVWRSLGAFRGKSAQDLQAGDFQETAPGEEPEPE
jgi:hypothetical protein